MRVICCQNCSSLGKPPAYPYEHPPTTRVQTLTIGWIYLHSGHLTGLKRSNSEAGLNQHLEQAHSWIRENGVENTDLAYGTYDKRWTKFCLSIGIEPHHARPEHVVLFMKSMTDSGLSISTINSVALSAIAGNFKLSDETSPTASKLVREAKAVVRRKAKPAGPGKLPLPPSYVVSMVKASPGGIIDDRDNFLVSLMMAGFLRESEAADLEDAEVWLDTKDGIEMLLVLVNKSKTDHERRGHTIVIGAAVTMLEACPIALYKRWKQRRNPNAKYLFHQIGSTKKLAHKTPNGIIKKLL
jgi:hypothetical protein